MQNKRKIKLNVDQSSAVSSTQNSGKNWFAKIMSKISNVLYPPNIKCICCGKDLPVAQEVEICANCMQDIDLIDEKRACKRCGAKLVGKGEYCLDCMDKERAFDMARSVCVYSEVAQRLIHGFKFGNKTYLARTMSRCMANVYLSMAWNCDIIVPVPISKRRLRQRGYNQAAILASGIAEIIKKPVDVDILLKTAETHDQVGLNYLERQDNLQGSMIVSDKQKVKGKSILLIDDVMTTGATANVCAELLKKAKAQSVYVLTFAHGAIKLHLEKNAETKQNNKK